MTMRIKRSEKQLMQALSSAEMAPLSERHVSNLRKTLENKRAEKKQGRIEAAHKRWATIKANRAAKATEEVSA